MLETGLSNNIVLQIGEKTFKFVIVPTNNSRTILRPRDDCFEISLSIYHQQIDWNWVRRLIAKKYYDYNFATQAINIEKQYFFYFGQQIFFSITDKHVIFEINEKVWKLKLTKDDKGEISKKISLFLKKELEKFIFLAHKWCENLMQISNLEKNIKIVKVTLFWGKYILKNNEKTFKYNLRLIHFDPNIIYSVIIHELVHITHHNHGPEFKKTLKEYVPNYKQLNKYLSNNQFSLIGGNSNE
ncbi:YgjP-like metallopeptidase domain-containing protein [Mycoplasma sp. 4044]